MFLCVYKVIPILYRQFLGFSKKQEIPQSQFCVYFPREENKHLLTEEQMAPPFFWMMEGF